MEKETKTQIKNEQFEIQKIEGTPCTILDDKENQEIWILFGNQKIKKCKTKKEATAKALSYDWDFIGPIICIISETIAETTYSKINNKINKK